MPSLYLSYSHKDCDFARKIAGDLQRGGVQVWIDENELKVGDSFVEKMREGIKKADYLAIVVSPNSINSRWVRDELELALSREADGQAMRVLPLVIGDCEIPSQLAGRIYADFRQPLLYDQTLKKVFLALGSVGPETTAANSPRIVAQDIGGLSAANYALISGIGLIIGMGLLIFYVYQVPRLIAGGAQQQVFYLLLLPWALASAAFLFGAMRSFAGFSGRYAGMKLELGGAIVLFCLVIVGGFKLVPLPQPPIRPPFDVTVRAHSDDGSVPIITTGSVILDIDNDRRKSDFDSAGEAEFKGIPGQFYGETLSILPQVPGYEQKWQQQKFIAGAVNLSLRKDVLSLVKVSGSIVPIPKSTDHVTVSVDGQKVEAVPDRFGKFELSIQGNNGDRPRFKVYSGRTLIYDDYQVIPGPITLSTQAPR